MSHNAWKYTVKNALMYNPTGVEFTENEIEYRKKNKPEIDPTATRMNYKIDYFTRQKMEKIKNEKQKQLQKMGKLGIDGNIPINDKEIKNENEKFVDYEEPEATGIKIVE